ICSNNSRQQVESRFINKNYCKAVRQSLFLSSGQTSLRHSSICSSSRWAACWIGVCGVQPSCFSNLDTCALWYETPNSLQITVATREQVQTSPRNPYASAPCESSSGMELNCSRLSLKCLLGRTVERHASSPFSSGSANHWLIAARDTPNA